MMSMLTLNVAAQTTDPIPTVTIGSGTETSGDFPTYAYCDYSYTQQLYTASELGATGGAIMNLGFCYQKDEYAWDPIEEFARTLDIYIVSTDKTAFDDENDWMSVTSSDLCFSGSVTFTADEWTTITLDNPFVFDGSSSIVIAVYDKTKENLDYLPFLAYDGDGQCLYIQDDGTGDATVDPLDFDPSNSYGGWVSTGYYKNQIRINAADEIAKPRGLTARLIDGSEVELSWLSSESTFELSVNGHIQNTVITGYTYKLEGLQYKSSDTIRVRAKDGDNVSEWSDSIIFIMPYCAPEGMCQITFELSDGGGDGWDESAIIVMVADDGFVLGKVTFEERWASKTVTMNVPDGKEIEFIWSKSQYGHSQYDYECSYVVKNHNGLEIFSGEGALQNPVYYDVDCNSTAMPCVAPTNLRVTEITADSALLCWDGNNLSYQLELRPWLQVGRDVAPADTLTQYSFDLSGFSGRGSIAIRHYDITGQIRLLIDDIVLTDSLGDIIFAEDFEADTISSYISFRDMDEDGYSWNHGIYGEWTDAHGHRYFNGKGGMDSDSWREYAGDLMPDDWLVISGVKLGGTLTLYARNYDEVTHKENFGVYVYSDSAKAVAVDGNSYRAAVTTDTPYSWRVRTIEGDEKSNWVASSFMSSDNLMVFSDNGNWNDAGNWAPMGVPTYANKVIIEGEVTIPDSVIAQARKIILKAGGVITIDEGGQLKQGSSALMVNMKKSVTGGSDNLISSPIIDREPINWMGFGSYCVDNLIENDDYYDLYAFDPTCEEEWVNGKITDYYRTCDFDLFKGGMKWGNAYYYSYKEDHSFTYTGFTYSSYMNEISEPFVFDLKSTDEFKGYKLVGNPYTCNCKISFSKQGGAVFLKPGPSGYDFDLFIDSVALAPGEGAFIWAESPGSLIYSSEVSNSSFRSLGKISYPVMPTHGIKTHQDAGSVRLTETDGVIKLISRHLNDKAWVSLVRSFEQDKASTVCVPFAMTDVQGGTLYEFAGVDYDKTDGWVARLQLVSPADSATKVNRPYIFIPSATGNVTFSGLITSVPADLEGGWSTVGDWSLIGSYSAKSYGTEPFNGNVYSATGGEFVKAGADDSVKPFYAFLKYTGVNTTVPERIKVTLKTSEGTETAVGTVNTKTGEITIDEWYGMDGRKLDAVPSATGLYLNNSRKVMIE
ncbi:MAG: hypothetical protein J6V95_05095 [Bacteroidaceae bacterium]|nr:hypothetical protein [Bacteroidaceae bacterium]